ncbi:hypothetical protein [Burkholderia singularis]|nr:hypothetical protein [Burkholderia singularis]
MKVAMATRFRGSAPRGWHGVRRTLPAGTETGADRHLCAPAGSVAGHGNSPACSAPSAPTSFAVMQSDRAGQARGAAGLAALPRCRALRASR